MADIEKTRTHPVEQFWEMTGEVNAGMLGIEGSGQHMQPMYPNCDPATGTIWFYTKSDSDLAQAAEQRGQAHFCVVGKDHDYHACVSGALSADHDPAAIDRFWGTVTAAWFNGKDDPNLTMLKLELEDGVAWGSVGGAKFGWEIMKANMSDKEPDVGVRQHFTFDRAGSHADTGAKVAEMAAADGPGDPRKAPRGDGQF